MIKKAWTLLEVMIAMTILLIFIGLWSQILNQVIERRKERRDLEWIAQSMDLWTQQITKKGYDELLIGRRSEYQTAPSGKKFIIQYEIKYLAIGSGSKRYGKQITWKVFKSSRSQILAKWTTLLETTQP